MTEDESRLSAKAITRASSAQRNVRPTDPSSSPTAAWNAGSPASSATRRIGDGGPLSRASVPVPSPEKAHVREPVPIDARAEMKIDSDGHWAISSRG
jgi:hypothetical protein